MAHPVFTPGTRVKCTYRVGPTHPDHVGTILADDDPRGWKGSLAFPDRLPTVEEVRAHIEAYQSRDPRLKEYDATRATVAWDFGKVYRENADALYTAE